MRHQEEILNIIEKIENGTATPDEVRKLDEWYYSFEDSNTTSLSEERKNRNKVELFHRLATIEARTNRKAKSTLLLSAIAIAAILLVSSSIIQFLKTSEIDSVKPLTVHNDIQPGGNNAILTLANGKRIELDQIPEGDLKIGGATKAIKLDEGLITYQKATNDDPLEWNTISTPIGGQYKIILSDGTAVWLNAASSIRFPNKFKGNHREVFISGETYFEVRSLTDNNQKKIPFKVITQNQTIEVLGTEFNLNAYGDNNLIKTTLVEGSVRLTNNQSKKSILLNPGEKAEQNILNQLVAVSATDVESDIAWKAGFFKFHKTKLTALMKQLERWYPIEVVYENHIPNEEFYGRIDRSYTLSEVLKVLQLGDLKFRIEDHKNKNDKRKLYIMK